MHTTAAGPFAAGDRVHVDRYNLDGTVAAVAERISVQAAGAEHPHGEIVFYVVDLDVGDRIEVADRDGILTRV